ncbi:MAG: hypothetical protein COA77_02165 [Thaumarchaeota archaeon]|nr:MAG: hypothetical protein COA77_02165 [Nitrososphaerota archaeon]
MVDGTITNHSIRKGKKLEDLLEGCLSEITSKLQKNDIDSYFLINKKQGGRSNIGPEAFLCIRGTKNYYFYFEAKNNKDIPWSASNVKKKILRKFQKLTFYKFDKHSETYGILIGHTKISQKMINYLNCCGIASLDTGELGLNTSSEFDCAYREKLKTYILKSISAIVPEMKYPHTNYHIEFSHKGNLTVKYGNQIIKKYLVNEIEGNGIFFIGPKLMDGFGVGRKGKSLKIMSPWKVYVNGTKITRRSMSHGWYISNLL